MPINKRKRVKKICKKGSNRKTNKPKQITNWKGTNKSVIKFPQIGAYTATQIEMQKLDEKAWVLYYKCIAQQASPPDPTTWIGNQTQLRSNWERIIINNNKLKEPFKTIITQNDYYYYMNFMYKSYPPGFGDTIMRFYDSGGICDGAKEFENLKQKQNRK